MSSSARGSRLEKYEVQIPKPSAQLVSGGIFTYMAGIFLLFSFASPYWLVSWEYTFNQFKRMGLWEFCFERYRHPYFQYDRLFSGCHYVYSENFRIIREWLLPGWLMAVQAFMTLAFMSSFGAQGLLALLVTRWPLNLVRRYEWLLTVTCAGGNAAASILLFLSVAIFGGECYRRDWMPYPAYNYPSWAYAFAVVAMFIHAFSAFILWEESKEAKERSWEIEHQPVMPMHETGYSGGMSNPSSETHQYV